MAKQSQQKFIARTRQPRASHVDMGHLLAWFLEDVRRMLNEERDLVAAGSDGDEDESAGSTIPTA